ncbi:MAG: hypothetical protein WCR46_13480 [Deltaproteobacteria bacterium]
MNTQYKTNLAVVVCSVSLLLAIGLIAIGDFTLQNSFISRIHGDAWLYLKRQLIAIPLALIGALLAARFSSYFIRFNMYLAAIGIGTALIIVLMHHDHSEWRSVRFFSFPVVGYVRLGFWVLLSAFPLLATLLTRLGSKDSKRFNWKDEGVFAALICGLSFMLPFLYDLPMLYLFWFTTVTVAAMSKGNRCRKLTASIAGLLPLTIVLINNLMTGYWWQSFIDRYNYKDDPMFSGYQTWVAAMSGNM